MSQAALTREPRAFEPLDLMRRVTQDMDRMFHDLRPRLFRPDTWRLSDTSVWAPTVEVFTRNGQLVVRADVPGVSEKDVHVELQDGMLMLSGERKQEKEVKEQDYYSCERSYGSFARTIALPEGAKIDEAKAVFKNGVLEVSIPTPKAEERHARKLEIKTS